MLKLKIKDIITMLCRIVGLRDASKFEHWMFAIIAKLMECWVQMYWEIFINDRLHKEMNSFSQ
jgi:hypothetical protein